MLRERGAGTGARVARSRTVTVGGGKRAESEKGTGMDGLNGWGSWRMGKNA